MPLFPLLLLLLLLIAKFLRDTTRLGGEYNKVLMHTRSAVAKGNQAVN